MKRAQKLMILSLGVLGILGGFLIGEKPQVKAEACHAENSVAISCDACMARGPGNSNCVDVDGGQFGCAVPNFIDCCGDIPRLCDD
jgi:hypothetical protein